MPVTNVSCVAAVAGRRVDAPGTSDSDSRLPSLAIPVVKAGIERLLEREQVDTLVASGACGTDILALEAALKRKARIVLVLPFEPHRFRKTSVTDRGEEWGQRFDRLVQHAKAHLDLVVLPPASGGEDDAYQRATEVIIERTLAIAKAENKTSLAIAAWDERVRGPSDATQSFLRLAESNELRRLTLSTRPLVIVRDFIDGRTDPDTDLLLDLQSDLTRTEPVLANELARDLASRFLKQQKPMTAAAIDRLWRACKKTDAFGYARRLLGRRREGPQYFLPSRTPADSEKLLRQQHALCTSKDSDLSAALRSSWSLDILNPDEDVDDPETQGIAGGIWKRRWEWDGLRQSLERALSYYRRGMVGEKPSHDGYLSINCAFLLDLLASLTEDAATRELYEAGARQIRERLVPLLIGRGGWGACTLAEAYIGLGQLGEAAQALAQFRTTEPDPWELATCLRQLVRLGQLRNIAPVDLRPVLASALDRSANGLGADPRLTSVLVGRVGLALSGGGFRASLYHAGVLARLAEADVLRHVEVLSCVSGGSIVGALYYLTLRKRLQANGEELEKSEYIQTVTDVIDQLVLGVSTNIRTRVLSRLEDSYSVVSGNDVAYAKCVARILHDTFYQSLIPEDPPLHELLVQPKDAPHNFHPGRHNWERRNKVPALILNAATLNTGHSWQFTARSIGESPFSVQPEVDSVPRLRRPNYHAEIPDRSVQLRDAVAASACVPGLFAPMQLNSLYDGYQIKLADGGVYENQGSAGLIEQDCQVMLVSDASGQLGAVRTADGGHVGPLLRSIQIFQERMRQLGYDGLIRRYESGQLRGLAYVHLTQGLSASPVDWVKCEDPHRPGDQLPASAMDTNTTFYGVDKDVQRSLADMRTDLDTFSEVECAALMASGYLAMGYQLGVVSKQVPALPIATTSVTWWFSRLLSVVSGQDRDPLAFKGLTARLSVGSSAIGRYLTLDRTVRRVFWTVVICLSIAALLLIARFWDAPILNVKGLAVIGLVFILRSLRLNWAALLVDPRRAFRLPAYNWAGAIALFTFARVVIKWVDPRYLKHGTLETLFAQKAAKDTHRKP